MKVVITGGCGFIGQRLTSRLLALGELTGPSGEAEPIEEIRDRRALGHVRLLPVDPEIHLRSHL